MLGSATPRTLTYKQQRMGARQHADGSATDQCVVTTVRSVVALREEFVEAVRRTLPITGGTSNPSDRRRGAAIVTSSDSSLSRPSERSARPPLTSS